MKKLSLTLSMAALLGAGTLGAQTAAPAKPEAPQQSKPTMASSSSTSAKPAMAKTHTMRGQIVSVTNDSLVLSSGKQKTQNTFVLNMDTKREGNLNSGEMARIEYRTQGAEKIATLVQVQGLKTAASKAPKSGY